MTYSELLLDNRWQEKRAQILKRDDSRCIECLNINLISSGSIVYYFGKENTDLQFNIFHTVKSVYANFKINKIEGIEFPMDGLLSIIQIENERYQILSYRKMTTKEYTDVQRNLIAEKISISELKIKHNINDNDLINYILNGTSELEEEITDKNSYEHEHKDFFESMKSITTKKYSNFNFDVNESPDWWTCISGLHVHHKYYQLETNPWDYPDSALVTLCWKCHEKLHSNSSIDILDKFGKKVNTKKACLRCFGAGYFPIYKHVNNGICFRCNGSRFECE